MIAMKFTDLTFDTEAMIAGLRLWVETESPATDVHAVNRVVDLAAYDLATLGANIERIPGRMGFADTLRACVNPETNDQPGILICCHADTVHEIGSITSMPYRRDGNYLWGPGITSMKAGAYISLEVVRNIVRKNLTLNLPVTFLIVSDKEFGCPSTRELIEATASGQKYVLIPGTAEDPQTVYTGRAAEQRYKLDVKVDTASGSYTQSAISEMAHHVVAIDNMSTDEYHFKVAAIRSGQWVNFAEKCTAEVISEALTEKAVAQSLQKMMSLNSSNPDKGLHVNRSVSLPLWQSGTNQLACSAAEVASSIGLTLNPKTGSGSSLANITASTGVTTLDGAGVVGTGLQSRAERILVDSLTSRARLLAGLLTSLS